MPKPRIALTIVFGVATVINLHGQTSAKSGKPGSDILIFTDGEKLIGSLQGATSSQVVFKSNMAGTVTVEWNKVQELRSTASFAAIPKGVRLRSHQDASTVPQGALSTSGRELQVTAGPQAAPQSLRIGNVSNVVSEADFQKAFERTHFLNGWKGGATAGISLT
jgi:hypothetical protein